MEQRNSNITTIAELRSRRRARKLRNVLLFALSALMICGYFFGVYRQAFTVVTDLWEDIRIGMTPAESWPIKTGLSTQLRAQPLSGGFVQLGQTDLMVYSAGGNRLRSIQHGYARPAISVGNSRFCLYNRSGTELRVESRTRTLYTQTFTTPILLAEMSQNGSVAVVNDSTRAVAELTVYDTAMKFRYSWTATQGMPSRVKFAPDNKRLAVACLSAQEGSLQSTVYLLDTRKDDVVSQITASAQVLQLHWLSGQKLLVIYDTRAAVYDPSSGKELAVYSYGGESLLSASVSGQNTAFLFSAALPDSPARLLVLDPDMQLLADARVPSPAKSVVCTRTAAYILRDKSVAAYTLAGEFIGEAALDASPLAVVNAKQLLVFSGGSVQPLEFTRAEG